MKILVIDDNQKHLNSALQTLAGHDVTICSTHDEALKLLQRNIDRDLFSSLFAKYRSSGMKVHGIGSASDRAVTESRLPYQWDAVLCDLLMPAGQNQQGYEGEKFIGQEMPIGWSLALMASRAGAKYVAVVTDTSHHDHPASAMLDSIGDHIFDIDGAKVLMTNTVHMVDVEGADGYIEKGKNWGEILNYLVIPCPDLIS
jgi:CheY-like chemotaxis protein